MIKDEHFNSCCEKCKGKCCKVGGLYITHKEFENLNDNLKKHFKEHMFGHIISLGSPCPFLKTNGCILKENRFLECKLYPFEVKAMNKLILKKECPFNEIYDNNEFLKKSLTLLKKYIDNNIFDENDVISILANIYPDKL